jgi:dolichyl-phosphate mannosyltransferase polypeptide 3
LKVQVEIIPVLPFWALITLASYLVARLGLGVMTFNDCNDAYTELMGQIDTAKMDLKARSVGTD